MLSDLGRVEQVDLCPQPDSWPSAIDHILLTERAAKGTFIIGIIFDFIEKETTTH